MSTIVAHASPPVEASLDRYPTRMGHSISPFKRHDPVVHSLHRKRFKGPLNQEQVAAFERDGMLVFENFFPQTFMRKFLDELTELQQDSSLLHADNVIRENDTDAIRSVFGVHSLLESFQALTRDSKILPMIQQLLGENLCIHHSRINYKPGFSGLGFNWHSDFETWHAEDGMPAMKALSCSIAITENNEFNGPLMLIPGSHKWFIPCDEKTPEENWKRSLRNQTVGVPAKKHVEEQVMRNRIVAPKGQPGTLVLFECNTLHASNTNMSPFPRSNVFFVYNRCDNALSDPYCGQAPRPWWLADREMEPVR